MRVRGIRREIAADGKGVNAMGESQGDVEQTGFADNYGPDDDVDFAEEHEDTTFADETADGPEHAREPDEPRGRDGLG
jgi:hypothetical protein